MTTPRPSVPATDPPATLPANDLLRYRTAANHAVERYPGPAGEILFAEIMTYAELGYVLGSSSHVDALVTELMKPPT